MKAAPAKETHVDAPAKQQTVVAAADSSTVRTKCVVTAVTVHPHGAARVHLQPEFDEALGTQLSQKDGKNSALTLEVSNPSAVEFFAVGKAVYLDLTPVA
jgi:hypothetical protein